MKRRLSFLIALCLIVFFLFEQGFAVVLTFAKGVANLDSVTSNNYYIEWYVRFAPNVALVTNDNNLELSMLYKIRDDSRFRGEKQEVNWSSYSWDPNSRNWLADAGKGTSKDSAYYGRYDYDGALTAPVVGWKSSSKAVKFKIDAKVKSGDSKTETKYIWVVRSSPRTNDSSPYYRWMTSRYDRAEIYKELANVWTNLQNDPGGSDFSAGMDKIIDISKGFVMPSVTDLAGSIGVESINLLGSGAALTSALAEVNGVLLNGVSWLSTASNLLGPGLRDSIINAVDKPMTKQAAKECTSLSGALNNVYSAMRADGDAMSAYLYNWYPSQSWKQKMIDERDAITTALNAVSSSRNSISAWKSSYENFSGIGFGVGSGTTAAANAVADNLNQLLDGIEKQLTFDKELLNKMII